MRGERGQASVEWIGLVLLVALGLAALVRVSARPEPAELGQTVLSAMTCAARDGCGGHPKEARRPARAAPSPAVTAPPLLPVAPRQAPPRPVAPRQAPPRPDVRGRAAPHAPRLPRLPRLDPGALRRAADSAWRRAWVACFAYERVRYAVLHPESRFPGHRIPPADVLRMVNDCVSPADLFRDLEPLRSR
jgi:hypothetical protein